MASITSKDITDMNLGKMQDWLTSQSTNPLGSAFGLNISEKEYNRNLWNLFMQGQSQQYNAEQAQIDRDWQSQMANTSWQRQVSDMQSAGVNPAMALGGSVSSGADSGSSSAASSSPASAGSADDGSSLLNMFSFFTNLAMQGVDVSNKVKQGRLLDQQARQVQYEADAKAYENTRQPELIQQKIDQNDAQIKSLNQQTELYKKQIEDYNSQIAKRVQETETEGERTMLVHLESVGQVYKNIISKSDAKWRETYNSKLSAIQDATKAELEARTSSERMDAQSRRLVAEAEAGKLLYETTELLPAQKHECLAAAKEIAAKTGLTKQQSEWYAFHLMFEMYTDGIEAHNTNFWNKYGPEIQDFNFQRYVSDTLDNLYTSDDSSLSGPRKPKW